MIIIIKYECLQEKFLDDFDMPEEIDNTKDWFTSAEDFSYSTQLVAF